MRKRPKSNVNEIALLKALRDGYVAEKAGHRKRIVQLMVSGFRSYRQIKQDAHRTAAFYKEAGIRMNGRSKPPDLLKEVMAYIADAKNESDHKLASKRARVLKFLNQQGVSIDKMCAKIEKYGGIERTYRRATTKLPMPKGLGHRRGLTPLKDDETVSISKPSDPVVRGPTKKSDENDKYIEITVNARLSIADTLREMGVGEDCVLKARRIDSGDRLLRIISIGEHDDEW